MIYFLLIILTIIALSKVFIKAGEPGIWALIPVFNFLILLEITGISKWYFLLLLIPVVNIVFVIWFNNQLSKSFGKSVEFTVGLVLLPFIFYPILGFGDSKYLGPAYTK
jgi:hypothetical protein